MEETKVTAEFAQTEVSSLLSQVAYHKRHARKHREAAARAAREAEWLRRRFAAELGFEVVIIPPAHSQEAQSNAQHDTDS